jgi:phage RecT family recombinase
MNQIALSDGTSLILPPARNAGATELYKEGRIDRLPQWLPAEIPAGRFLTAVAAEINGLDPDTNPQSMVKTAFNCAVLGLIPGQQLGHAHFVTFKMNKGKPDEWICCQLVVGFKGWLELSYGCGFLRDVHCDVVFSGEDFDYWVDADGAQIYHDIPLERADQWGSVKAAYCVWHATTGGHGIEVVPRKPLDKLKRRGNVWNSAPMEMAKKTAILRASKTWKRTGQMATAALLDDHAERDEPQPALADTEPDEPTPSLNDYAPAEAATGGDDTTAIAADYETRLQQASLPAVVEMVWDEVGADGRLLESDVEVLRAVYEDCKAKLKE